MVSEVRYARSGDVNIAYRVIGDGPFDVVFVPGTTSHVEFALDVPGLRALSQETAAFSRFIFFDKRGTGLSDPVDAGTPLEVRMDDVRARALGARLSMGNARGRLPRVARDDAHACCATRSVRGVRAIGLSQRHR